MHLGHAVGLLLAGGPRSGEGVVELARSGGATRYRISFSPVGWRVDGDRETHISDSVRTALVVDREVREISFARAGWVPQPMHLVRPALAPIWGKPGDEWRLRERPVTDGQQLVVGLENVKDSSAGELRLDTARGVVTAIEVPGWSLRLLEFHATVPGPGTFEFGPVRLPGGNRPIGGR